MKSCSNHWWKSSPERRGVITLIVILIFPVIMSLFGGMVDLARLWQARTELTTALDAAVLSGVKTWSEGGNSTANRSDARDDALEAAAANTVVGQNVNSPSTAEPVTLNANEGVGVDANDNASPDGELVLGALQTSGGGTIYTFCSNSSPGGSSSFAIRARKTVTVHSIWKELLGVNVASLSSTAESAGAILAGAAEHLHVQVISSTCP